ncbi:MAG: TIGR02300 family protein [Sphingomonadales bacterium]
MAKPEWGTKQQCPSCGTRFYDLNRTPITCVKCETSFTPEPLLKSRRSKDMEVKEPDAKDTDADAIKEDDGVDEAQPTA